MFSSRKRYRSPDPVILQFHAEALEERRLLAGNVDVVLQGNTLFITGDDSSNRIELIADGDDITVRGQGTDLNGGDQEFVVSRFAARDISIQLFDGSDRVTMIAENNQGFASTGFGALFCGPNTDPNGTLSIDTGDGSDRVTLVANNTRGVGFFMDLDVDTGAGNDRLLFEANNPNGMFGFEARTSVINTGSGNDRVEFEAANGGETIGFDFQTLLLDTGDDNDRVKFEANNIGNSIGYRLGLAGAPDSDLANRGNPVPAGGDGPETIWQIFTGDGSDRLEVFANNSDNVSIGYDVGTMSVSTGEGRDRFTISAENEGDSDGLSARFGFFDTGGDDDRVRLNAENSTSSANNAGIRFSETATLITQGGRDRVDLVMRNEGTGVGIQVGQLTNLENPPEGFASGEFIIDTGNEDDRINIGARNSADGPGSGSAGMFVQRLNIQSGSGDDQIQIKGDNRDATTVGIVVNENVRVSMENGDDQLALSAREFLSLAFPDDTLFDGGGGDDRLRISGDEIDEEFHVNFEDSPPSPS